MSFKFEKLRVLVVEDTAPMLRLITSILKTLGVGTVITATNGENGYKAFCKKRPDIVITDWHMEPESGLDLVHNIRNNPKSPNKTAPVIIVTGYSALNKVTLARDQGATEFLVKPFSANGLARRIAYTINQPRDFIKTKQYFGPNRRRKTDSNYQGTRRRISDNSHSKN